MDEETRYLQPVSDIIAERKSTFARENIITDRANLREDGEYFLADNRWEKIPGVICVFVDIRNSTGLSASTHDKSTAGIYELFTGTAVKLFHLFGAGYIDIKGDGVFALFNRGEEHRAFAAAMSFKTFVGTTFLPLVHQKLNKVVSIGCHMGIDQKVVLVKKLGMKDAEGRYSRKNEVWAGKPINMASKLAALSTDLELLVSERFYQNLSKDPLVQQSCGCTEGIGSTGESQSVWEEREKPQDSPFDFEKMYSIKTHWCVTHGKEWCEKIMALDA